jgi:hypothetical protein
MESPETNPVLLGVSLGDKKFKLGQAKGFPSSKPALDEQEGSEEESTGQESYNEDEDESSGDEFNP